MNRLLLVFFIPFLFGVISCNTDTDSQTIEIQNDTTEILRQTINLALNDSYIPDRSSLFRNTDSVIIYPNKLKPIIFPLFDNIDFKFMSKEEICESAKMLDYNTRFPNYLYFKFFQHNKDSATISAQVTCVVPQRLDSLGNCTHGFLCGGGFGLIFTKKNKRWIYANYGRWSD